MPDTPAQIADLTDRIAHAIKTAPRCADANDPGIRTGPSATLDTECSACLRLAADAAARAVVKWLERK